MPLTRNAKIFISLGVIIPVLAIGTPLLTISLLNKAKTIDFTLLTNAGVMIESKGVRIYIDPIQLNSDYADLPADVVLITHPHGDHCETASLDIIQKEDTVYVFPENMTTWINMYNGIAVNPEDEIQIHHISITAFYMYTLPVDIWPASHPAEANWTSYIVDIDGFTFFHAGDSKNIVEYEQLVGDIDVALLPLGPGCQTMADTEIVDVVNLIRPQYFIPIHFATGADSNFCALYEHMILYSEITRLDYWSSTTFKS
ncbi:MAG: MBL fold metallo-hydrolase [Candidatus Heimdallarchaeota archaeon]